MKKQNEPSAESLEQMPEIDDPRFRRRPGRGHHASSSAGEIVAIDADLWSHFGSAEAVNDALRRLISEEKKAQAPGHARHDRIDLAVRLTAPGTPCGTTSPCLAPGSSCRTQHETSIVVRLVV